MPGDDGFERIFEQNERSVAAFDRAALTAAPLRGLAVVTCMDARIDLEGLGLRVGDAHVIRNAGALATDDVIRSLAISQQLLGTREVVVIAHTRCGLERADEGDLRTRIEATTGRASSIAFGAFEDVDQMVRDQVAVLTAAPELLDTPVRGAVYDVETGRLRAVA